MLIFQGVSMLDFWGVRHIIEDLPSQDAGEAL